MLQSFHLFHYLILESLMILSFLSDSPFTWSRLSSLVCIVNLSEIHIQLPSSKKLFPSPPAMVETAVGAPTSLIASSSSYHAVFGLISVVYPHLWTPVNLLEGRDLFYWSSYTQTLMSLMFSWHCINICWIKKGEKERKRKVGRHKRLVKHLQSSESRIVSNSR